MDQINCKFCAKVPLSCCRNLKNESVIIIIKLCSAKKINYINFAELIERGVIIMCAQLYCDLF